MKRSRLLAALAWLVLLAPSPDLRGSDAATDSGTPRIRMGIDTSLVNADVNANDARAGIKIWADALSRDSGVHLEYLPEVLSTPEDLLERVRQGQVDAFSATTSEYLQVANYTDPHLLLVDQIYITGGEEYVILVHTDSGIRNLVDLRGRRLIRYQSAVMNLAEDWLETILAASHLGLSQSFFSQIQPTAKVSRAVLPVFFRQADACLVNRRAFDTMSEMNPQLVTKFRVLATSPKLIPVVVALHKNCSPRQKEAFRAALTNLSNSVAGRQILTIFGGRKVMATDTSILNSSIELINGSSSVKARAVTAKK